MTTRRMVFILSAGFVLSVLLPAIYAQDLKKTPQQKLDPASGRLVGTWEIFRTKEPGQPYRDGYKGRPFVHKGPNAFTLIMEYHDDGTFKRVSRVGGNDTVQNGNWKLSGNELRHLRKGSIDEEIMYLRFDSTNQYTSIEVFESSADPGLFAQFKRADY
ncbi:MAG: hypothetical protein HY912_02990 [Desulfomonile tiedjei]|uniref:Lipocalin-like domain-containing protein n=1 Tax=Desulfomonile tiedjei TaxID=2358 RepID=A0A9D6UY44_9BACT|nr:hypothetical protein [Desulfomonile tiedjei]